MLQANGGLAMVDCALWYSSQKAEPESPIFDPKALDLCSEMRVFSLPGQQDFHGPQSPLSPTLILNGVFVASIILCLSPAGVGRLSLSLRLHIIID